MTSFQEPKSSLAPEALSNIKISLPLPMTLAIGATTAPFLGLLLSGRAVAQQLTQLGVSSEELFRGDRLPVLPALKPETTK